MNADRQSQTASPAARVEAVVGRCVSCDWWAKEPWMDSTHARKCKCPKNTQDTNCFPANDGAGDVDVGGIWTGPDFGCIHFASNKR